MVELATHPIILLSVIFLAVMVLFLSFVGVAHVYILNRLALRISYLEGTLDMVSDSQERLVELIASLVSLNS